MVAVPFKSPRQQIYLKINKPKLHDKWQKQYGNAPGLSEYMKRVKRKKKKTKSASILSIANSLDQQGQHKLADLIEAKVLTYKEKREKN